MQDGGDGDAGAGLYGWRRFFRQCDTDFDRGIDIAGVPQEQDAPAVSAGAGFDGQDRTSERGCAQAVVQHGGGNGQAADFSSADAKRQQEAAGDDNARGQAAERKAGKSHRQGKGQRCLPIGDKWQQEPQRDACAQGNGCKQDPAGLLGFGQ